MYEYIYEYICNEMMNCDYSNRLNLMTGELKPGEGFLALVRAKVHKDGYKRGVTTSYKCEGCGHGFPGPPERSTVSSCHDLNSVRSPV